MFMVVMMAGHHDTKALRGDSLEAQVRHKVSNSTSEAKKDTGDAKLPKGVFNYRNRTYCCSH